MEIGLPNSVAVPSLPVMPAKGNTDQSLKCMAVHLLFALQFSSHVHCSAFRKALAVGGTGSSLFSTAIVCSCNVANRAFEDSRQSVLSLLLDILDEF